MTNKNSKLKLGVISALALLLLAGCGGGGDSGRISPPDVNNSPSGENSDEAGSDSAGGETDHGLGGTDNDETGSSAAVCSGEQHFEVLAEGAFAPENGEIEVATDLSEATVRFNAAVSPLTVSTNTVTIDGPAVFSVEAVENRVVVEFEEALEPETVYTINLDNIGTDCPNGIQFINDGISFSFETDDTALDEGLVVEATSIDMLNQFIEPDAHFEVLFNAPLQEESVLTDIVSIVPLQTMSSQSGVQAMQIGIPVRVKMDAENPRLIEVVPLQPMQQQTSYRLVVNEGLAGTEGQVLQEAVVRDFRTRGFITQLNRELISQIPGLGDGLNFLASALFDAVGRDASGGEGINNLDNLAVLSVPLVEPVIDALTALSQNPGSVDPRQLANLVESSQADGVNSLIAVCDPLQPAEACVLSLDLGLSSRQLTDIASLVNPDGFTEPQHALLALMNLASALDIRDAENALLGLDLRLLDPALIDALPGELTGPALSGLQTISEAFGQLPVIGEFWELQGSNSLVQLSLFRDGALLALNGGDVLGALPLQDLLDGSLPVGNSPLGQLFELISAAPGNEIPGFDAFPGADELEALPVIGDLLGVLNEGGGAPELPGFELIDVPVVGDILSGLLNLEGNGDGGGGSLGDIPVLGDLWGLLLSSGS